ncbi:hypothetical protein L596_008378 [Steinernema carpocapsae]|uniref:Uncharacterized protein n=1 Tax=Steinernema carpocapsae TaxID=34508 RepID=A0A4U5PCE5_STECR|nr:hypothetical protein L596_008378 [Steinernema carpocapsae]
MVTKLIWLLATLKFGAALDFAPRCGPFTDKNATAYVLPPKLVLKPEYLIDVIYVKNTTSGNGTAAFHEEKFVDGFTFHLQNRTGKFVFMKRKDGNIVGNDKGEYENVQTFGETFEIPTQAVEFFKLKDSAILVGDLVNAIVNSKDLTNNSLVMFGGPVAGIKAVHWVACNNVSATEFLQIEVAYADHVFDPPSAGVDNPVMLSFDLSFFTAPNSTQFELESRYSFQITLIDTITAQEAKENQKLPRGAYCKNMPNATLPAEFPTAFEASFQYTDSEAKNVDNVQITYDSEKRVAMFTLDVKRDFDLPIVGQAVLNGSWNSVDVVHDFNYGLQYVLSSDGNLCYAVSAINSDLGDVQMVDSKLDVRSASDLMIGTFNSSFYNDGKVVTDEGQTLHKYVTKVKRDPASSNYSIVEILFTQKGWTVGATSDRIVLHSVVHYHKNDKGELLKKTTIRMNQLIDFAKTGTLWTKKNVLPCLKFVKDSYYYVAIADSTVSEMKSLGLDRVGSALIETMAEHANISVLRIAEPYYRQGKDNVYVYFAIGESSGVIPAETKDRKTEIPLSNATAFFNGTLAAGDLKFTVKTGKQEKIFTVPKNAFGVAPIGPPPPTPPSPFQGYSGGSMFVLGLFSFLFGALVAVAGLLFYWRSARRRMGQHIYQVFE